MPKHHNFVANGIIAHNCQHVDVDDYCASEQMGKPGRFGQIIGEAEDSIAKMQDAGRSGYTILIRELQRRCRERYGRELVIIGYTGTDYRGVQPIINWDEKTPGLWRKAVCDITTEYLVDFGSVVPTVFGVVEDDMKYSLEAFKSDGNDGVQDFTDSDLAAMEAEIMSQGTLTQKIMLWVEQNTRTRNGVLVTCAGIKHCKEAASALPPGVTFGIVTQDTPRSERRQILKDAYEGKCRFVFQVGALTTGVNIPPWDVSVILRRVGSLTLLTQLLGRGMRKLKKEHEVKWGMHKEDHIVYDFAGAMDDLAEMYFSPMLEKYQFAVDSASGETKTCPICGEVNGEHARRCRHVDGLTGERCEYFWVSRRCEDETDDRGNIIAGCNTLNDIVARHCRCCGRQLIDPNKKLAGKHYTIDDFVNVKSFEVGLSNGGGVCFTYVLSDPMNDNEFKAYEVFWPESTNPGAKQHWRTNGIEKHIHDPKLRAQVRGKPASVVVANAHLFMKPIRVTHRTTDGGKKSVISRKVFFEEQQNVDF